MNHKKLIDLLDDTVNGKEPQVSYCGLKLANTIAGKPRFMADKICNILSVQKIVEYPKPLKIEHSLQNSTISLLSLATRSS
jgi:hypothetical protein